MSKDIICSDHLDGSSADTFAVLGDRTQADELDAGPNTIRKTSHASLVESDERVLVEDVLWPDGVELLLE